LSLSREKTEDLSSLGYLLRGAASISPEGWDGKERGDDKTDAGGTAENLGQVSSYGISILKSSSGRGASRRGLKLLIDGRSSVVGGLRQADRISFEIDPLLFEASTLPIRPTRGTRTKKIDRTLPERLSEESRITLSLTYRLHYPTAHKGVGEKEAKRKRREDFCLILEP